MRAKMGKKDSNFLRVSSLKQKQHFGADTRGWIKVDIETSVSMNDQVLPLKNVLSEKGQIMNKLKKNFREANKSYRRTWLVANPRKMRQSLPRA